MRLLVAGELAVRVTRAVAVIFGVGAVLVVSIEWLARQADDSNVLFQWLELGTWFGALAAALSLPSIVASPIGAGGASHGANSRSARALPYLLAAVATAFALCFGVVALTAASQARSHFFPGLTLVGPYAAVATAASLWCFRCVLCGIFPEPRSGARNSIMPWYDDASVAALVLAGSIAVIGATSRGFEGAALAVSQTIWQVVADDGFLTLVLVCIVAESLRATCAGAPGAAEGFLGDAARESRPADASPDSVSLQAFANLLPAGVLALALGILLGLRASEVVAAMTVPFVALAAVAGLVAVFHRRVGRGSAARAAHRPSGPALVATACILAINLLVCLLVVRGYARPVEALAVIVAAACAPFAWVARRRVLSWSRLAAICVGRVGFMVVYVAAGALLYIAADRIGASGAVAGAIAQSGAPLPYLAAGALFVAVALSRWLSPWSTALCALPAFGPAFGAAGADLFQTLALYCSVVAGAAIVRMFVENDAREGRARRRVYMLVALTTVFMLSAFPEIAAFLPEHQRLW